MIYAITFEKISVSDFVNYDSEPWLRTQVRQVCGCHLGISPEINLAKIRNLTVFVSLATAGKDRFCFGLRLNTCAVQASRVPITGTRQFADTDFDIDNV